MNVKADGKSINKTYLIYFISMILFVLVRILVSERILHFTDNAIVEGVIFSFITQVLLMLSLPLLLYCLLLKTKPKEVFKLCNFRKPKLDIILISFLFGLGAFVFNMVISSFFSGILGFFGYRSAGSFSPADYELANFLFDILLVAILPAICEEFMHRGILLQGAKKLGYKKSIFYSSLLFGLIHLNVEQFFYAAILGGFLATIAVASKNIWPAIIVHFVNNGIIVYLRGARAFGWFGGNYAEVIMNYFNGFNLFLFVSLMIVVFLLVTGFLIFLIYLLYKRSVLKEVETKILKLHNKKVSIGLNSANITENSEIKKIVDESSINLDYNNMRSILDIVLPKEKETFKPELFDKVFLLAAIFLGGITTVFTFIWGLL